ncbi:hypothetical protein [Streptomyces sp. NPDC048411]|uniref:DedA family protein n=1 Tax=Streptomyces sp. NPDC048411 TaxID=3157206 RepID=UPI003452D66F
MFVGRFTAVLRTLVPPLCGATGMPLRRYPFCSVVSSAVWASAFVLIGYVTGRRGPGDTSEGAGSCQCRQMPHATP